MKKASALLVAIALAIFGLAACGDDDDDGGEETAAQETTTTAPAGGGGGGGATTLTLSSPPDGALEYNKDSLQAKPGSVTINFNNQAVLEHDVVVEDESRNVVGKTELVTAGETSVTVDLQPGTYTFFCDVPGHREGGMEGTLTVN